MRAALDQFLHDGDPFAGSSDPRSAGNGSLMRLAPVAIRFWNERDELPLIAADQSRTTHAAPEAVDACVLFADMLAEAIAGRPRSGLLRPRNGGWVEAIEAIAAGGWRGKRREQIASSGYVVHSLEAALWAVGSTADFESAVLKAANLGEDSDTTAAVAGQLAGALYGLSGIPAAWLDRLAERAAHHRTRRVPVRAVGGRRRVGVTLNKPAQLKAAAGQPLQRSVAWSQRGTSPPPFAGGAVSDNCWVRSVAWHFGHSGVSPENTSVSNGWLHLLQM